MTNKDISNPLFDDDDELTIPGLKNLMMPKLNNPKLVTLPDVSLLVMPELPDELISSGASIHPLSPDEAFTMDEDFSVDDTIGSLLAGIDDGEPDYDSTYTDNHDDLAGILDSLGNLDDLEIREPARDESAIKPNTPVSRFESMLDGIGKDDNEDEQDYEGRFIDLDKIIGVAIETGASDIHLSPNDEVAFTVLGNILRFPEFGEIDSNMTVKLQQMIISNVLEQTFVEDLELDTSYIVRTGKYKGRRLRLSVGKSEGNVFMVFRIITDKMPTPDELNIPLEMRNWVNLPNGLILVNGPTGSGKSTTLSSLIQEIQFTRAEKVITIEKPIEFVYGKKPGQKAFITQREVGRDSRTFATALDSAMRQAPDIIVVGEVRNKIEIDQLLRAAETGHLAISTLHTTSCPATINRIRSMFEGDEQLRVLATLADNLRGMMTQTLVKSPDGLKRFAVREVLQINRLVKDYVLAGNVAAIRQYMEDNGITMEHELVKAVRSGNASLDSARSKAPSPIYFDELMESV